MEIVSVEARHVPRSMWGNFWQQQSKVVAANPMGEYPTRGNDHWSWYMWDQGLTIVRVELDTGHVGFGYSEDGFGAATLIINEHLARLCQGQDAENVEGLWDQLFRSTIPYGRKGIVIESISAVDIAVWDALGKAFERPSYELLGGHRGIKLRAYASKIHPDEDLREVRRMAADYKERGYLGIKCNWPHGPKDGRRGILGNLRFIEAVRDELGDEIEIMTDAYMGWNRTFATEMVKHLEEFNLSWLEEPLIPDDIEGHALLRSMQKVPIATGEHEFTRFGFQQLLSVGAADVWQPDVHRVGGPTEMRRIGHLASANHIPIAPHVYSAATLHSVLSMPSAAWVEHLTVPSYWEQDDLVPPLFLGEPQVAQGVPELPKAPGIGLTINTEVLPEMEDWVGSNA